MIGGIRPAGTAWGRNAFAAAQVDWTPIITQGIEAGGQIATASIEASQKAKSSKKKKKSKKKTDVPMTKSATTAAPVEEEASSLPAWLPWAAGTAAVLGLLWALSRRGQGAAPAPIVAAPKKKPTVVFRRRTAA